MVPLRKSLAFTLLTLGLSTAALAQSWDDLANAWVALDGGPVVTVGDIESVALAFSARFSVTGSPCNSGACSLSVTDLWQFKEEGTAIAQRRYVNCLGAGITCTDDAANDETEITVSGGGGGAPTDAKYVMTEANAGTSAEFSLGTLTTGLLLNTVSGSVGTPSPYAGTSCTNQFPRSLNASGAATCASVDSASIPAGTILKSDIENVTSGYRLARKTASAGVVEEVRDNELHTVTANSAAITNTTSTTDFDKTISLPGGTFAVGDLVEIEMTGIASTTGTTAEVYIDVGGTTLTYNNWTADAATDLGWWVKASFTVRSIGASASLQKGWGAGQILGTSVPNGMFGQAHAAFTKDSTGAIVIKGRWAWGAASVNHTTTMQTLAVKITRATTTVN